MTSSHPLDRAVWNALTSRQASLALHVGGVVRFDPAYATFAAAGPDARPEDWLALTTATGRAALFEADAVVPEGLVEVDRIDCLQMVATNLSAGGKLIEFEALTDADGPEMLALATLTQPGPFFSKTHLLGPFIGIRREGVLVAMAGERLSLDGFSEISGVCTHPDHRGHGYAGALMRAVGQSILDRGDTVFLHARIGHAATIAFYGTLGFRPRTTPSYVVMEAVPAIS
ncbi:GNAT family N-acetyltransferase [Brevundimonas sp. M20]|uniref:GNAT family N-acetyltransferase n=1 Tax=Brevundimonas sp. M20 TaxID=2591463 RepID=UPI001147177F|nr:GNAT family N-acetyltransferase [Brevundimonas sp. M20]QDH74838.1 GNAT family N-acetyltransferase [Brevundimonas sp. M20]